MYFFQNTSAIQWCRGEIVTTLSMFNMTLAPLLLRDDTWYEKSR